MPIKAIVFDIGGVIVRTEDLAPRRKWDQRFSLPDWGVAKIVFDNTVAVKATIGQATDDEVWAEVAQRLDLTAPEVTLLRRDFWAGDRTDQTLLALIESLRPRYKTGIISNAWPGYARDIRAEIHADRFDEVVFSSEFGQAKPGPEIYRHALQRLGIAPAEAVFVDDMPANIDGAQAVGMAGILFKVGIDLRSELQKLGVTI